MTNKLATSFSVLAKAALPVALVGGIWAQPALASPAARVADAAHAPQLQSLGASNVSGNPYFPLESGAKWTYDYITHTSSFTSTQTVAGVTGTQAKIDTSTSLEPGKVTSLTYTIGKGGTVEVESSSGSGSSFSSSYWIPTATQIQSCSACKFSGPFSASILGKPMTGTLTESATALGTHTVTVPAGTFSTQEVELTLGMHATGAVPIDVNLTFHLYLAKNVGMVENAAGSMAMNFEGHAITTNMGTDKLASYKI